jgi:hypothetical protein
MKQLSFVFVAALAIFAGCSAPMDAQLPMKNDPHFRSQIDQPQFEKEDGPLVMVDGGHNNFFVMTGLIKPLLDLLANDGYRIEISRNKITDSTLARADIFLIITAMSSPYTDAASSFSGAYSREELSSLQQWVVNGGSLIAFSEHFPFDVAVSDLLESFDIKTSIGVTIDYDFSAGDVGHIIFEDERLNGTHPTIAGKRPVKKLKSYGGSSLRGDSYSNLLQLSGHAFNVSREWMGVEGGPIGSGDSQGLAGAYGKGRVVALGDSNGFVAMVVDDDNSHNIAGMNDPKYDWRNFVLNTFDWLSGA